MRMKKVLYTLVLGVILTVMSILMPITSNAATTTFGLVEYRKPVNGAQNGYKLKSQKVWKVVKYNNGGTTIDYDTAVYCLRAGYGFYTSDPGNFREDYNAPYDFKNKSSIPDIHTDLNSNYKSVLWILDHAYISTSQTAASDRTALLTAAGIPSDTELTDDDIDVIQQLAIWYYTNASDTTYHKDYAGVPTLGTLEQSIKSSGVEGAYNNIEDINTYRYADMELLYQYIVTAAGTASNLTQYDQNLTTAPITLETTNPKAEYDADNSRYIIGPYKINKNNTIPYTMTAKFTNKGGSPITNYTLLNSNKQATSSTINQLVGQQFYISMSKDAAESAEQINFSISGNYTTSTMTYWTINGNNQVQPLVVVEKEPKPIIGNNSVNIEPEQEKEFDLSLRKFITEVNGEAITTRIPNPDVTPLKNRTSTTALYNHSKVPVIVRKGNIVTYTIRVYNEGEVDGYVGKITDYLPEELEFIYDSVNYPTETRFNAGNGWLIDSSNPRLISTTILSYSSNAADADKNAENMLKAFDGTNLDYKEVQVKCKVKETATRAKKLTNLAQITDSTDSSGNAVTDRDSTPNGNFTLPSDDELPNYKDNEIGKNYIPGQEDDDDFEKVKIEEFDLALRKFITEVNGETITTRIPNPDVTPLKNGTSTTALYNHTKAPVAVAPGDIVTYTIRIYNEAEIAGYANKITDYLPAQLEYLPEDDLNKKYEWETSSNGRTLTTTYLSKAKETSERTNLIQAFDGTNLSYKEVQVRCKVKQMDLEVKKITNLAQITEDVDLEGNAITDRDSAPDGNFILPLDSVLPEYKDDEINRGDRYIPGQEDDDDFEKLKMKEFDLSLRKFITEVNGVQITERIPQVDVGPLKNGTSKTAIYNHSKLPVAVEPGDIVTYTIRVYNEGEITGYAKEITDYLPAELEYLPEDIINKEYEWEVSSNGRTLTTTYLSKEKETDARENLIKAFDGTNLSYKEVQVRCKVKQLSIDTDKITNLAQITEDTDLEGNDITDRDSTPDGDFMLPPDSELPSYKDDEISKDYVPGQEDDDDFEKIELKEFDLSLRKFITGVNNTQLIGREPIVDVTPIKEGETTAIYEHTKIPVNVQRGYTVTYTIRVYNEGETAGYANEIVDYLPEELEYLPEDDLNKKYEWEISEDGRTVTTRYLSREKETSTRQNKIEAFNGENLAYKDVQIKCKVKDTAKFDKKLTNLAEITENNNNNGEEVYDRDSEEENMEKPSDDELPNYKDDEIEKDYVPGQEDDDDFEKVRVVYFDLALRKFITGINDAEHTGREPIVDVTPIKEGETSAIYNHPKDPVNVENGNIVTYTLRIYNEGLMNGYASEVIDDVPEGLIFLPEDETNIEYRWVMYKELQSDTEASEVEEKEILKYGDKEYIKTENAEEADLIKTDYLSKEQEKQPGDNLIKAFDPTSEDTLYYKDIKVKFKVTEPNTSDRIIVNTAEITEDTDETNEPVDDIDSTPGNDNEWEEEDDLDKEFIRVKYFDLALKKWVSKVILIENGEQTVTDTGHTGEENPEPIVKVDLHRKKLNDVTVKFEFQIKITNEGEIAGYAKEVTDYIPEGLKFVQEDNKLWYTRDALNGRERVATRALENTLLQPGESASVPIILTWINDANNMGVKTNIAEISEDYNDSETPDIDSDPDNFIPEEDDQDDAPVMLSIELGQTRIYFGLLFLVLGTIGVGIILIKKFVL